MTSVARYPYRHDGPPVHGSKLVDYLISEQALREDCPELFNHERRPIMARKKKNQTDENTTSTDEDQIRAETSSDEQKSDDDKLSDGTKRDTSGDMTPQDASSTEEDAQNRLAADSEAGTQDGPRTVPDGDDQSSGSDATRGSTGNFPDGRNPDQNKGEDEVGTTAQGSDVSDSEDPLDDASNRPLRTAPFTQSIEAQNPQTRQEDHMARASERRSEATEGGTEEARNEEPQ